MHGKDNPLLDFPVTTFSLIRPGSNGILAEVVRDTGISFDGQEHLNRDFLLEEAKSLRRTVVSDLLFIEANTDDHGEVKIPEELMEGFIKAAADGKLVIFCPLLDEKEALELLGKIGFRNPHKQGVPFIPGWGLDATRQKQVTSIITGLMHLQYHQGLARK